MPNKPKPSAADKSDDELVEDEVQEVAPLDDAAVAAAEEVETKAAFIVRALQSFHDIETKRDYKAGDIVPWDYLRAEKYQARGLVTIEE